MSVESAENEYPDEELEGGQYRENTGGIAVTKEFCGPTFGDKQINLKVSAEFKRACEDAANNCRLSLNEWTRQAMQASMHQGENPSEINGLLEKIEEYKTELEAAKHGQTLFMKKCSRLEEENKALAEKVPGLEKEAADAKLLREKYFALSEQFSELTREYQELSRKHIELLDSLRAGGK